MKKSFLTLLCGLVFSLSGSAQTLLPTPFFQDKLYVGASLSGLDLNWNQNQKWKFDVAAKAGYLFDDNWMVTANTEYNVRNEAPNMFKAGAGLRYYFEQNGIYLGAGANYAHVDKYDDFLPTVQVGYAFFLTRTVTIEPEVYYEQSFKNHKDYSGVGFRIGFGIYFE
jgi:hypothetical protein